jgi:hypothetical protein
MLWVWDDWKDATRGRKLHAMDGPELLTHERVFYWRSNRRIRVSDWQITVMLDLDMAFVSEALTPLEDDNKESKDGRAS